MSVPVTVEGIPAAQGSKKGFIRGRKVVLLEMDKKLPVWRATVEATARKAAGKGWEPLDGPVSVAGTIHLPKPRTTKYKTHPLGPPDLDKLQRAIGDALTKSQVITDDSRIVHWDIRKAWATDKPGATLTITQEET